MNNNYNVDKKCKHCGEPLPKFSPAREVIKGLSRGPKAYSFKIGDCQNYDKCPIYNKEVII